MMKNLLVSKPFIFLLALWLQSLILCAQKSPAIGSEKDSKEKLVLIKKALPDFRKNLTKTDGFPGSYPMVTIKMGDGDIQFRETDSIQSLTIRYSSIGFTGSLPAYQQFYHRLISLIKKVFGKQFTATTEKKETRWDTRFFRKNSDYYHSAVTIKVICDWTIPSLGPDIELVINSQVQTNVPKNQETMQKP